MSVNPEHQIPMKEKPIPKANSTRPRKDLIVIQNSIEIIKSKISNNPENSINLQFLMLISDRLYFYSNEAPPKNVKDSYFFNIDEILVYKGYNKDFGPLHLAQIHRYWLN